jgi:hypothetical protein
MIYCVDTSSLIAAWQERYPIENFPKFWDRMDSLVKDGRLISPIEVFNEIKKRSDDLHDWLRSRKDGMFRDLDDEVQIEVATFYSGSHASLGIRSYARLRILSL